MIQTIGNTAPPSSSAAKEAAPSKAANVTPSPMERQPVRELDLLGDDKPAHGSTGKKTGLDDIEARIGDLRFELAEG